MRRFYLFKRNSIYYVQLRNPQTGRLCSARSTGQTDEQDASIVVADWLANGIPEANGRPRRKAGSVFTVEAVCKALRDQEDLSLADAGRIVAILKERGLVEQVRLRDDGNSETLVQFLPE